MIIFAQHIPYKNNSMGAFPEWYNKNIILRLKQKYKLWKRYKATGDEEYGNKFKQLRSELKREIRDAYSNYLQVIKDNIKTNPKKLFSHMNKISRSGGLPSVMSYGSSSLDSPQKIANGFAKYFSSSFSDPLCSDYPGMNLDSLNVLSLSSITQAEVLQALNKIKPTMVAGPDLIPAFLISDCKHIFLGPLTSIFKNNLRSSANNK